MIDKRDRPYIEAFCIAWLKGLSPMEAAKAVTPDQDDFVGVCLRRSRQWVVDPEVLALKDKLLAEHGEEHFLPTKSEIARKIYGEAEAARHPEDKAKLLKLFCEVQGYIEKIDKAKPVATLPNVMIVKEQPSDAEWATKLAAQQKRLTKKK